MSYDTLILDGEGVVFDTEGVWDRAQEEFLRAYGANYDRPLIKNQIAGRSQREGMSILKRVYQLPGDLQKLIDERQRLFWKHLEGHVSYVNGFETFIAEPSRFKRMAVATSMDRTMLNVLVESLDLKRIFGEHIYSSSDLEAPSKPAPDLFLFAAKQLGSNPRRCIVVEDAPVGIAAAQAAGMSSVGLCTTFTREELGQADFIAESWEEAAQLLHDATRQ
jgi:beta-phosphoglucomutase-like phosphatase (HAD superfamily)